jgi:hypothetical protein
MVAGDPAEIRTKHMPNARLERYFTNLFTLFCIKIVLCGSQ